MRTLAPRGEWVAQCATRLRRTSMRAGSVTDCVARPLRWDVKESSPHVRASSGVIGLRTTSIRARRLARRFFFAPTQCLFFEYLLLAKQRKQSTAESGTPQLPRPQHPSEICKFIKAATRARGRAPAAPAPAPPPRAPAPR